jgi:hypothetical protein
MREVHKGDHEHYWFQYGDGTMKGGPRFRPDHRVFSLTEKGAERASEALWDEVMRWLDENDIHPDGWTSRCCDDVLRRAVWRFRKHQQAEAEMFAEKWLGVTLLVTSTFRSTPLH